MAKIDEARKAWTETKNQFKIKKAVRTALTGDGRGTGTSNFNVTGVPGYIYVREQSNQKNFFPVLNRGKVGSFFNVPVFVGYDDLDPEKEQVIGINYNALPAGAGGSIFYDVPAHGDQHEFGGGDEVFIDPRLFLPGLVSPTDTASMQVKIKPFVYYYRSWGRYPGGTSDDLTQYKPTSNSRFVLIALETETGNIVYRPGNVFEVQQTFDIFITNADTSTFQYIPKPSGNEVPLGAVLLTSTTTKITWTTDVDNMVDARLHIGHAIEDILYRLEQLEGYIGNNHSLPATGAAGHSSDEFKANSWAIQGYPVADIRPQHDQVLVWSSALGMYKPETK